MIFSSRKYRGNFTKTISVETNDPENPKVGLSAQGQVLMPAKTSVSRLSFGKVASYIPVATRTVTLTSADGGEITPEIVPSRSGAFDTQLCEIIPGHEYEIVVTLDPDKMSDRLSEPMRIRTGIPESPEIMLSVTATRAPRLTTAPAQFMFPSERKDAITRVAKMQWDDGKPANILGVTSNMPGADVKIERRSFGPTVTMTLPPGTSPPGRGHTVTIKTDDPSVRTYTIPVVIQRPKTASGRRTPPPRGSGSKAALTAPSVHQAVPVRKQKKE